MKSDRELSWTKIRSRQKCFARATSHIFTAMSCPSFLHFLIFISVLISHLPSTIQAHEIWSIYFDDSVSFWLVDHKNSSSVCSPESQHCQWSLSSAWAIVWSSVWRHSISFRGKHSPCIPQFQCLFASRSRLTWARPLLRASYAPSWLSASRKSMDNTCQREPLDSMGVTTEHGHVSND